MSNAFLYRMPSGIPGVVNRVEQATIEAQVITPAGNSNAPAAYGLGVVIDAASGQVRTVTAGDTALAGFLVKPYPVTGNPTYGSQTLSNASVPPAAGACDVLKRGYMTVLLGGSTAAAKEGQVYVWTAASSGAHVQGEVEAADPGGSGFAVTGCQFMGPADANGNVEIRYNI